jgi:uncharacterized membrane protein YcaP (DUF421 family)
MKELLLGNEDWSFLGSVVLRTVVMFVVILGGLRIMGKRGVKHLSVFELGVIVGLGSAAGDPMFYRDVGLLPCLVVFGVVLGLYHILEVILNRSEATARTLEGSPIEILRHGELIPEAIDEIEITTPELFAQLRLRAIAHLGQLDRAIVEPNGEVSVYFKTDAEVKPGLPIIPALYDVPVQRIEQQGLYSCRHCGHTEALPAGQSVPSCSVCAHENWTRAVAGPRVA